MGMQDEENYYVELVFNAGLLLYRSYILNVMGNHEAQTVILD